MRVAILRAGFDATVKDPAFAMEAERARLLVHPNDGCGGRQPHPDLYTTPADLIAARKRSWAVRTRAGSASAQARETWSINCFAHCSRLHSFIITQVQRQSAKIH